MGVIRCFGDLDFPAERKDSRDRSTITAKLEKAAEVEEWTSLLIGW